MDRNTSLSSTGPVSEGPPDLLAYRYKSVAERRRRRRPGDRGVLDFPKHHVIRVDGYYYIRFGVRNIDPESVSVTIQGGELSVSGMRWYVPTGSRERVKTNFRRITGLPGSADDDPNRIAVLSDDETLLIVVPKKETAEISRAAIPAPAVAPARRRGRRAGCFAGAPQRA